MPEINVKGKPATIRSIYRRAWMFYFESINIDRSWGPYTTNITGRNENPNRECF